VASWIGVSTEERRALASRARAELEAAMQTGVPPTGARRAVAEQLLGRLSSDQRNRLNQLMGPAFRFRLSDPQVGAASGTAVRR
jgi:hypothetical protein